MSITIPSPIRRVLVMVTLILAGEAIFLLPFVLPRIFRPTMLDVFGLTNLQLGIAFSFYGMVAMVSYFFGGPLADRFSAKRLLAIALLITGLGGIVLATIPSLNTLMILYGFWGLTTILLSWAALIKATREWGGNSNQGRAYGLLDGGRGLVAALLASIMVAIFATLLPKEVATATLEQRSLALKQIIWIFNGLVFFVAIMVWIFIPDSKPSENANSSRKFDIKGVIKISKIPAIWLNAVIVLCAYVAYKGTDDFSLLASDAFGYDDVESARIGTISFWVRPIAAILAGIISDLYKPSKIVLISFLILIIGSIAIALGAQIPAFSSFLIFTISAASIGIYGLRGIYFALLHEAHIPITLTGTAVGLISVIGYTPDVFMGPIMGFMIDRSPGALGHQHVFAMIAGFGILGFIATLIFQSVNKKIQHKA